MHPPRAFVEHDLARLDALIAADPFVTLACVGADGMPLVSHLPILYRRDGEDVLIEGHWAKANPQARHTGKALLVIHGPHTYVSPGWYPDKESAGRVPTWNYAVAHLHGKLQAFDDEASLGDLVARLSERFESAIGSDWVFDAGDPRQHALLRGIVGFRFVPERIALTFKLSQNHPLANRTSVIAALSARDDADARAVADLMRTTLPQEHEWT